MACVFKRVIEVLSPAILITLHSAARASKERLQSVDLGFWSQNAPVEVTIHVANPSSIPAASAVQVMLLDKTGTVTEPGLKLAKVAAVSSWGEKEMLVGCFRCIIGLRKFFSELFAEEQKIAA